jgi:hypothetical protein
MRLALLCILLGSIWLVQGQDCAVSTAGFPFEFREGLLWVSVRVPESGRVLNFLLDSGAEASVLDLRTAKELGLALGQRVGVRGVGVSTDAYWCSARSAKANEVELPGRFLALDLGKLSGSCERRVDGLIGADFFRGRAVQIDFHGRKVRLLDPEEASMAGEVVPLEVRRCGMRAKASINGKKPCWFRVDTGCASALQWVTGRVAPNNCTSKVAVGLVEMGIPQTRTTVKIGGEILKDIETGLHRSVIFDGEAGMVGNGLLSQFETVTIDSIKGRLVLGPRLTSAPKETAN